MHGPGWPGMYGPPHYMPQQPIPNRMNEAMDSMFVTPFGEDSGVPARLPFILHCSHFQRLPSAATQSARGYTRLSTVKLSRMPRCVSCEADLSSFSSLALSCLCKSDY
jgi:hypothetical protein